MLPGAAGDAARAAGTFPRATGLPGRGKSRGELRDGLLPVPQRICGGVPEGCGVARQGDAQGEMLWEGENRLRSRPL